eukprot:540928_1
MSFTWMISIFLFTLTFDTVFGTSSDCGYFAYAHIVSPLGSQFCTNTQYLDWPYTNHSESFYFVCENDIPYRYSFETTNCTGNQTRDVAETYYDESYGYTSYSCSDVQCDYIHYSLKQGPDSSCADPDIVHSSSFNLLYSTYRAVDYCATYVETNATTLVLEYTYFAFTCDSSAMYTRLYSASDCSGFPLDTVEQHYEYNCFTVHECSQYDAAFIAPLCINYCVQILCLFYVLF